MTGPTKVDNVAQREHAKRNAEPDESQHQPAACRVALGCHRVFYITPKIVCKISLLTLLALFMCLATVLRAAQPQWSVQVSTNPAGPRITNAGVYVDFAGGSDSNTGASTNSAFKHCPGDTNATGNAAATVLVPGTNVFFKSGVTYMLAGDGGTLYQAGINLFWQGTSNAPITYTSDPNWGTTTNRPIFTDGYTSNYIAAFFANGVPMANLVFSNLEIGPIGGSAALPADPGTGVHSKNGYGLMCLSTFQNITVANCYLHNLGYTYNTIPMDANSVSQSDGRYSAAGIEVVGSGTGLTVTNCQFTHMHTGIDMAHTANTSNIVFAANYFHDFMVWGIDVAGVAGLLDYVMISGNTFAGMGWAYSPPNWMGYNYDYSPHQDPIFWRTSNTGVTNGVHNSICGNTFHTTQPNEVFTACMFLEYAPSVNIYNNLFDVPNAGLSTTGQNVYSNCCGTVITNAWNGGGAPPILISYELDEGGTNRVLNNTFVVNLTNGAYNTAITWESPFTTPQALWPANAYLQVENNVGFSWTANGTSQGTLLVIGAATNNYPVSQWTVDYNDWRDRGSGPYFWLNNSPGTNVNGSLAAEQLMGLDPHGMTNDPQFVSLTFSSSTNSAGNSYQLQAGSPCIHAGVDLSALGLPGLGTGLNGVTRPSGQWDIGAYQR